MDFLKRIDNEKRFTSWEELQDGSRMYWFVIEGRLDWSAKYLKMVDKDEQTILFWQEIYNEIAKMWESPVEMHIFHLAIPCDH